MALLEYFKKSSFLPNPNGPLSEQMPSYSNKFVKFSFVNANVSFTHEIYCPRKNAIF